MKSILVPIQMCDSARAQMAAALRIADRFDSHIDGVAPSSAFEHYVSDGLPIRLSADVLESFLQSQAEEITQAESAYREFMLTNNVAWEDPATPSNHSTAGWLVESDGGDLAIAQRARLYDLSVLARCVSGEPLPRAELLETVLFESGRPILVVPPEPPAKVGEIVTIAWDGSVESARAVSAARPFLRRAKRVNVLTVTTDTIEGPSAKDVVHRLLQLGVRAKAVTVKADGDSIGETILAQVASMNADLLVKGAYTHSRLRQMVFGGATKHILTAAEIPVFMVH